MTKRLAILLSLVLMTGAAMTVAGPAASADQKEGYGATDKTVSGEVVSADIDGKTLTIKSDTGTKETLSVDAKALTTLKSIKTGDKVTLKVKNNAVTEIKTQTATSQPSAQLVRSGRIATAVAGAPGRT
jgi:hypothetical protein